MHCRVFGEEGARLELGAVPHPVAKDRENFSKRIQSAWEMGGREEGQNI